MKNKKQNLAKFIQKVGEGRLTYGFSSRSFRAFFSEKKLSRQNKSCRK